jgi:hypothetical protein
MTACPDGGGAGTEWPQQPPKRTRIGTLVIDLWDIGTKQALFRGVATDTLSDKQEKNDQKIDKAVEKNLPEAPDQGLTTDPRSMPGMLVPGRFLSDGLTRGRSRAHFRSFLCVGRAVDVEIQDLRNLSHAETSDA